MSWLKAKLHLQPCAAYCHAAAATTTQKTDTSFLFPSFLPLSFYICHHVIGTLLSNTSPPLPAISSHLKNQSPVQLLGIAVSPDNGLQEPGDLCYCQYL